MNSAASLLHARLQLSRPGFSMDATLDLPGGRITALFGASGSGKTTLLRSLAGLEASVQGHIRCGTQDWLDSSRGLRVPAWSRRAATVFQDADLLPHLDVAGNLAFATRLADTREPNAAGYPSQETLVAQLGLQGLLGQMPHTLSGGERQRVSLARALCARPRLLLLDEPLAHLDARWRTRCLDLLAQLCAQGPQGQATVVLVSHALEEVARLADHLVLVQAGRVLAQGEPARLLARLDLPLGQREDAGVVIHARVKHAAASPEELNALECPAGTLWLAASGLVAGQTVRLLLRARDASLALSDHVDASTLNRLPGQVQELLPLPACPDMLVRVDAGGMPVLARVTRQSASRLALRPGLTVWVHVKSVALNLSETP